MSKEIYYLKPKPETNAWDLIWLAVLLIMFAAFVAKADKPSARQIMEQHQESRKIAQCSAAGKITTGGGGKKEVVKEFQWWRKLKSDNERYNTFTKFLKPAEVRDQAILFQELEGQKNDIQMYLPAYKKVRRVESNQQGSSFMGSEFSYSDITTPHIDDYAYELKKEEACPVTKSASCYVIETTPSKDSVLERTGVKRSLVWVIKNNNMIEKAEYYDRNGELWKVLLAGDFLPAKGGKLFVAKIKMQNVKSGRFTDLEFSKLETEKDIPDRLFTTQNLQSGQ